MLSMALDDRFQIVATAENGDQAVELAKEHTADAVVIDVDMPGGAGNTAVRGSADANPQAPRRLLGADPGSSSSPCLK